ncbi:MAG TPA: molybdenum cofactor guanylyltransferase [Acidimicrobiia bacterium]|nr:molybdenum cofactor guanylyltransferase [Acidimicrobiia bacterium]
MTGGLLLTGGVSRRMGFDKAELRLDGERLADRAARVLLEVCEPVLEVGPGRSALTAIREQTPGEGPLVAMVAGAEALPPGGAGGLMLLLAVDLPFAPATLLQWLADRPGDATVVPTDVGGAPQPCCARYSRDAIEAAARLVADGHRSLRSLLEATAVDLVGPEEWTRVAEPNALDDVDTPEDVTRLGLEPPA